jgi:hypothetical protein
VCATADAAGYPLLQKCTHPHRYRLMGTVITAAWSIKRAGSIPAFRGWRALRMPLSRMQARSETE